MGKYFLANNDRKEQGQNCEEACEAKDQHCAEEMVHNELQKPLLRKKKNLNLTRICILVENHTPARLMNEPSMGCDYSIITRLSKAIIYDLTPKNINKSF